MNRQQLSCSLAAVAATVGLALTSTLGAQAPAPATGNATRGAQLFSDTYNCYACHGFDAQSGERRLVPMNYTQDGFITFVQSSPLPNMPPYPDAAAQDLADIYAYIRTIPADAPTLDQATLLRDILERKNASAGQ